jgi:hypothetical protein
MEDAFTPLLTGPVEQLNARNVTNMAPLCVHHSSAKDQGKIQASVLNFPWHSVVAREEMMCSQGSFGNTWHPGVRQKAYASS